MVIMMKIDLHVHTSEISMCGQVSAEDTVRMYKEAGYDAIVITNHFNNDTASHFARHGEDDFFAVYKRGFGLAEKAGEKYGLLVLNGYELRFNQNCNDYLVFGLPDEAAKNYADLFASGPSAFSSYARENGALFYQAHPFRGSMTIVNPSCLFGIEVINGNPRHDSRNDIANAWADKFSLHKIGGSDCHQPEDVGRSGIITDAVVGSSDDLIKVLSTDNYRIIRNTENGK